MDFPTKVLGVMALIAALCFGMLIVSSEMYLSVGSGLLDGRMFGYDAAAVRLYLGQLSEPELWFYAGPFRLLDTVAPPLLALTFVGLIWTLGRSLWRMAVILPLVYLIADLRENALVGQILNIGIEGLDANLVMKASNMTQLKWAFLVLSLGVVLWLWKKGRVQT